MLVKDFEGAILALYPVLIQHSLLAVLNALISYYNVRPENKAKVTPLCCVLTTEGG